MSLLRSPRNSTARSQRGIGLAALMALAASACSTPAPAPTQPRAVSFAGNVCPQPAYPPEARRHGAEGSTLLEFEVNAEGKVTRVAIIKTSGSTPGHQVLDALAMSTVAKCNFAPAPGFLSATARISYQWKLQG